ncbi:hypothetical protein [Polaribacter sp.]|uniref:hypothetical protein n=1 Tax=Polaribacter sp. TaxID=1920175 RepID=UPI004047D11B|tara:strand:- start:1367 stop:1549 length:183 start_codon:yes stop_codon:yes gene_type:complete
MELVSFAFIIVAFIVFILIMRAIGAWMLRIDEIIKNQKTIIQELKKANGESQEKKFLDEL